MEIDGFRVATALDEKSLESIGRSPTGVLPCKDDEALSNVYKQMDLEWRTKSERTEMTAIVAGTHAACSCSAAPCRCSGSGGWCSPCLSPGRLRCSRCWACCCCWSSTCGSCGASAARPCGTRASRWSARRCRHARAGAAPARCALPRRARQPLHRKRPPKAMIAVPLSRTSVILALDVSGSMCSTDVKPNRLSVAQDAARSFVEKQPSGVRIGLVAFAGFAELIVPPTTTRTAGRGDRRVDDGTRHRDRGRRSQVVDAIASINADVSPITTEETYGAVTRPRRRPRPRSTCRTSSSS